MEQKILRELRMRCRESVRAVQVRDVEADSGGETEAGTVQRDVVRSGVISIPVSFSVSSKWLKMLGEYRRKPKINVVYFNTETLEAKTTELFMEGYKASPGYFL